MMRGWLFEDISETGGGGGLLNEENSTNVIWWNTLCSNRSRYNAFWDDSLTVHTHHPDFTECFQKSILSWISCGFLWFSALFYVPYLYYKKPGYLFKPRPNSEYRRVQTGQATNREAARLTSHKAVPNGSEGLGESGESGRDNGFETSNDEGVHAIIKGGEYKGKGIGYSYDIDGRTGLVELPRHMSRHCMLKLALSTALACLSLIDLVWYLVHEWVGSADHKATPIDYLDSSLHLITYLLAGLLTLWSFRKYIHSSGVLFMFWFIQLLVSIVLLRSLIIRGLLYKTSRSFTAVTSLLNFIFTSLSFITVLFSDLHAKNSAQGDTQSRGNTQSGGFQSIWRQVSRGVGGGRGDEEEKGEGANMKVVRGLLESSVEHADDDAGKNPRQQVELPCPEITASFLSRLFFFWFSSKIYHGWRRTLKTEDIWDIRPEDSSQHIVPTFEQHLRKENVFKSHPSSSRGDGGSRFISADELSPPGATFEGKGEEVRVKIGGSGSDKKQGSLLKALCRSFGPYYSLAGLFLITQNLINFVNPQLLSRLLSFIQSEDPYLWRGYMYAVLMFLVSVLSVLFMHHHFNISYTTGMRVKTALVAAIYRKSLTISPASRKQATVGEIVNLMSVDTQKCQDACAFLHYCWTAPITVSLTIYFLYKILGASTFAGLAFMLLFLPMNSALLASKIRKYQRHQMTLKDSRIKLMNQILSGIKILKLYAWEEYFADKILSIRNDELKVLRKAAILNSITYIMWFCNTFIVAILCFATYVLTSPHHILDAQKAFVSLSLIMILNFPLTMLPPAIMYVVQASVSLKRIQNFLLQDDINPDNVTSATLGAPDDVVCIKDGSFSWGKEENAPVTLKDINISVGRGKLVAVVGLVGCGKSSLLSALLGEMEKLKGSVSVRGSVAYVSQQAWIQNLTLKDNILFSRPMNHSAYNKILDACSLRQDLSVLPGGDSTEIGERGINLSGGQKQRISLARAVYQDCDVYLLDDSLSAVDAHVGRHIFSEVIGPQGLLRDKTRVWVTHSVSFLPQADEIIVMKDGCVSERGSFSELLSSKGDFSEFITTYLNEEDEGDGSEAGFNEGEEEIKQIRRKLESLTESDDVITSHSDVRVVASSATESPRKSKDAASHAGPVSPRSGTSSVVNSPSREGSRRELRKRKRASVASSARSGGVEEEEEGGKKGGGEGVALIQQEEAGEGTVKLSVVKTYIQAGRPLFCALTVLSLIMFVFCQVTTNIWLSEWTQDKVVNNTQDMPQTRLRLSVYAALGVGQGLSVLCMALAISLGSLYASRTMHASLLRHVLRCPLPTFFDTTPLGRIINRFSKDVDIMDTNLPQFIQNMLMTLAPLVSTIIIISYTTPIFIAVVVPLLIFFLFLQRVYVTCARQIKRIDSICRSPLYAFFSETLNGVSAIRAFKQQTRFINQSDHLLDNSQRVWFESYQSNRWIGVWAEFIGDLIILFTAVFAVMQRDQLDSGLVGLSLSFALQVNMAIVFTLRSSCEVETFIVAVERIKDYTEQPTEAEWIIAGNRPSMDWPERGEVEFRGYKTSYRPGLDLVLRDITCTVSSMQKVGLVGRTGAGKSSMTLALFRILEASGGQILIDGVDISLIGLHDLRRKLTVIPQDPVLFSGSLRFNLDPSDEFRDEEIWRSLEQSHLKRFVESLPDNISHECGEDGENLSVGQRQLVCLARALLRKSKVLILDEATAAVDLETDDLIQATIRSEFKECTVITIAHRLNTIIDYERIIVLDRGEIIEQGSPTELLSNKSGIFFSMALDAGLVTR